MRTAAFYLILSLWPLCVSAQSESPAPAGEINSPKPDAVSRRECEGAFTSLPAALRFDTLTSGATEQKLERGVWRYLCARKALTAGDWEGVVAAAQLPPRTPPIVGGSFIRSLLLSNQFDVPGYSQISIEGAIIDGPVDLSHEILRTGLALLDCTFSGLVDMSFARSDHDIDFSNSTFYEGFRGKSMHVSGSLYFGSPVDLVVDNADAPTGNDISAVNGNLESAVVSWLKYLDLAKSSIQGDFRLASAFVEGETNLFDISVAKLLDIQDSSIADVNATVATVGQLEVKNTSIRASSNFQADGISIAHSAYIDRSRFPTTLYLTKATIQSDLSFRGSALTSVDLSEARVNGDLMVGAARWKGKPVTKWENGEKSILAMDYAHLGLIRAPLTALPRLSLNGVQYNGFGSVGNDNDSVSASCEANDIATSFGNWVVPFRRWWRAAIWKGGADDPGGRPLCFYEGFLLKSQYYASAYGWLEHVLKQAGNEHQARRIAILGKDQERGLAWKQGRYFDWSVLFLSGVFIGYGYNVWLSAIWAAWFVLIGAAVFTSTSAFKQKEMVGLSHFATRKVNPFLYSFDIFIPVIQIKRENYEIEVKEAVQRWYFYGHRVMGYLLSLFLIGGLSGLAK